MVSPLFTAFALIACGRADVPPAPPQPALAPEVGRGSPDKGPRRKG